MNPQQLRISLLWFLIVFCYLFHGYYHLAGLFYGVKIELPGATGNIPAGTHIFSLLVEILPLFLGLATLYIRNKKFFWLNFIVSILFLLLNVVHLGETLFGGEWDDYRQVGLLTFIFTANLMLTLDIRKQIKPSKFSGQ